MYKCSLALLLFIYPAAAQMTQPGSIGGTVVNETGKTVAGATVWCHPATGVLFGAVSSAETDENGYFSITGLPLGEWLVHAMKEDEGYPNRRFAFYGTDPLLSVTLDNQHPVVSNIALSLGAKGGILQGSITDATTGHPVAGTVHMGHQENPVFLESSEKGAYRKLIPAHTKIIFSVRAPGYLDWYYPGVSDSTKGTPLVLKAGETTAINVQLQPIAR